MCEACSAKPFLHGRVGAQAYHTHPDEAVAIWAGLVHHISRPAHIGHTAIVTVWWTRGGPQQEKKLFLHTVFPKKSCGHTMCWQWAVGGWWLAVGDGRLVAVGGGWWWLAAVGGWGLVVDGGWQWLAVGAAGGWQRLAAGGWWRLAVGGWRLMVPWGGP